MGEDTNSADSVGPSSAGVSLINAHGNECHGGKMECSWDPNKGRVLHAKRAFKQGEIILVEGPLHIVQAEPEHPAFKKVQKLCKAHPDDFDFDPLWYWCALRSLTAAQLKGVREKSWPATAEERQNKLLLLHHDEESMESSGGVGVARLAQALVPWAPVALLDALLQCWVLNCFDYSEDPQGYCTYFYSSFMSHSCQPNAFWHYSGDDHVLRAREDIAAGDEVCISYLSEDWLVRSAPVRRWDLHETKRFWCACERCQGGLDMCRGFVCPACHAGPVYPPAPEPGPAEQEGPPSGDMTGALCDACGHKVTDEEAKACERYEKALETLVDNFEEAVDNSAPKAEDALELEEFLDNGFSYYHWLADRAYEQLSTYYEDMQLLQDCSRVCKRRCDFGAAAYPGLSPGRGWALENYGDALQAECNAGDGAASSSSPSSPSKKPRPKQEEAARAYTEALHIIRLAYGEDNEHTKNVESKLSQLYSKAPHLQKCLPPSNPGVEANLPSGASPSNCASPLSPDAKRRRLSRKQPSPLCE